MPIKDHKAVEAFHNGKRVAGIYRCEAGTFQAKKGVVKIHVPEYEYSFDFTVSGKRYRSIFGKDSDFGKVGPSGQWVSHILEHAVEALLRFKKNAAIGEGATSVKEELALSRKTAEEMKRQEQRVLTVEDLIGLFLKDIAKKAPNIKTNKPRTINEYRLNLERDVVPAIGKKKAKDVNRDDIADIIDKIADRGKIVQSNRTLSTCSRLFNWALKKGKVVYNPCALMEKYIELPRTRVLTEPEKKEICEEEPRHEEIKRLWSMLSQSSKTEARILMLCILLGSRPGEVCNMRWEDIDDDNWWSLNETKVDVILDCHLTSTTLSIIGSKKKSGPVFPMVRKKKSSMPVDRLSRFVRDNKHFGLPHWQPRDLRRTFTTLATGFGVDYIVLDIAQARKNKSVIREHYDKRRYYKELRQLFDTVEREILRVVNLPTEIETPKQETLAQEMTLTREES